MSQEQTNRSDVDSPVTARLPAKLVDLAFSIAAFQQSEHQHAQIIERNAKHVIQAITSQYPAPERFQERQRRSTRQNTRQDPPWPTNWATDQRALGQSLYESITDYSKAQSDHTAALTRQNRNPGPSRKTTESDTTTSTVEKGSTSVDKDNQRVNRSPTVELPQNLPRITPESERNSTSRMDEPIGNAGTNTNVNMTLSLEDLQRLMGTMINTAMDRRFGPENPAVRNPGLPRDPGPPRPPVPPIPPVLGGGTGLVAPYQPSNTTTIRARDIGYFDPDPTRTPVGPKDTHQVYHNVFAFTNRLKAKAITVGVRIGVSYEVFRGFWERYTVQDVRRRREPTEDRQLMVTAGRNAHQDANEAAICMLAYEHIDGILRQHVAKPIF
ncbi:MAG: hypothetical protein M1816_005226 [Peltula sp. TS41687]|nr:MAG: hypothetical protein M1816_005226 [Peltula sp. TS41687]